MPRIELINVTKQWGKVVAVNDLSMVIEDREFVTLLGPSGCGKTTTLRMIAGLETPTKGKIIIGDRVVFDSEEGINVSPASRDVGFLFQNYALWPHMTVYKNISFGLENLKWKKDAIKERVHEVMKTLQIEELKDRYPSELSGGQQQRVAIARTLAPNPQVLFMDEPLSNLDAKLRAEMRTELKRLHNDTHSTFVYVTHDQLEATTLATRTCLMELGILQQYDKPLDIYHRPANLFVADFVGSPSMNLLDVKAKQVSDTVLELNLLGIKIKYTARDKVKLTSPEVVIGIRPEFLSIRKEGLIKGVVYSTLPSGMESTIKIAVKDEILTAVEFGSIDYDFDQKVNFDITTKGILLYDKESGNNIAIGACEVIK